MIDAAGWSLLASVLCGLTAAAVAAPLLDLIDQTNGRLMGDLIDRAQQLDYSTTLIRDLMRLWWLGTVLIILIVGVLLQMPPIAAVLTMFWLSMPRTLTAFLLERRRVHIRDQMVMGARLLASQYRAGLADIEGLKAVGREVPAPLGSLITQCVRECERGLPLAEVLLRFKQRMKIDAISVFVIVLLTCKATGGKVAEAMQSISQSLEELQRVERKRESETSAGRTEVLVLALFPLVILLLVWLLDPTALGRMFSMTEGQWVLSAVMVITYVSLRWAYALIAAIK
jgi:tight adherence protein B